MVSISSGGWGGVLVVLDCETVGLFCLFFVNPFFYEIKDNL